MTSPRNAPCRSSLSLFPSAPSSLWCVCSSLLASSMCMGLFLCLRSYGLHEELAVPRIYLDCIAIANGAIENTTGDTVLDLLLDDASEGTGPVLRVVAHLCQQVPGSFSTLQHDVPLGQAWAQAIDLDVH